MGRGGWGGGSWVSKVREVLDGGKGVVELVGEGVGEVVGGGEGDGEMVGDGVGVGEVGERD